MISRAIDGDDFETDEGWIWLPWEEIQELQRLRNEAMNQMMDLVYLTPKK